MGDGLTECFTCIYSYLYFWVIVFEVEYKVLLRTKGRHGDQQVRDFVTSNFFVADPSALEDSASLRDQGVIDSMAFLSSSFLLKRSPESKWMTMKCCPKI